MQRNVDGDQIVPFAKIRKRRLGWQTPKPTPEGSTPARNTETPSKMSSNPELSEVPRHTEVCPKKHKLVNTQLKQKDNGKQIWKD